MMKVDTEETKSASPRLVIEKTSPIVIPGKLSGEAIKAPVQTFLNVNGDRYDSIAYIENDKTIVLVVISSVSQQLLREDYSSFVQLVQSYVFFGSNVHVEHIPEDK